MRTFDPHGRLQGFSADDWEKAARALTEARLTLANASVAQSWAPERLLALLICLEEDELCKLYWHVYHCEEHAVLTLNFRDGIPRAPFSCSECEVEVSSTRELSFDLECVLSELVQLKQR